MAFDDTLSLPTILAWLRFNAKKIMLGGLVCAILAAPLALLKPKSYESSATLLVSPPAFKEVGKPATTKDVEGISEMMPRAMPVEAYKVIALSPPLLYEVIQKAPLEDTAVKALKERLEVELVQMGSRTSQGVTYTQTFIFRARAASPDLAAKIAQTWAEVFKEQVDELATKGVEETFLLLDTLHKNTQAQLEQAELALAEHKKAWNLDLFKAQLEAKQKLLTQFEDNLKQTDVDLASGEMKLKALEEELAKEPQKDVFFRAPSDDAYWIMSTQDGGKGKVEPDQGLRTEVSNPNYVSTRGDVILAREEVEGLKAQKSAFLLKLDELGKEMEAILVTLADRTVEQDVLTREAESLKSSYATVRAEYEKGRMADQTQSSDIVIAGKAITPKTETGFTSPKLIVVAGLVGMFLMGAFLALKDLSEMAPKASPGAAKPGGTVAMSPGSGSAKPPTKSDAPEAGQEESV